MLRQILLSLNESEFRFDLFDVVLVLQLLLPQLPNLFVLLLVLLAETFDLVLEVLQQSFLLFFTFSFVFAAQVNRYGLRGVFYLFQLPLQFQTLSFQQLFFFVNLSHGSIVMFFDVFYFGVERLNLGLEFFSLAFDVAVVVQLSGVSVMQLVDDGAEVVRGLLDARLEAVFFLLVVVLDLGEGLLVVGLHLLLGALVLQALGLQLHLELVQRLLTVQVRLVQRLLPLERQLSLPLRVLLALLGEQVLLLFELGKTLVELGL